MFAAIPPLVGKIEFPMSIAEIVKSLLGTSRGPAGQSAQSASTRHWLSNPWHAVSVIPGRGACESAKQALRVRFLSKEAPRLPLAGCQSRSCQCRYRHHDDRRRSLRRASDVLASGRYWPGKERRSSGGRRSVDQP